MGYEYNFRRGLRELHGFSFCNTCNSRNPRLNYYQLLAHYFPAMN